MLASQNSQPRAANHPGGRMSEATVNGDAVEDKRNALQKIFDWVINVDAKDIEQYIEKLRSQNPGITDDALAAKIVSRKSMKNGLVGAATGVGGFITLPITVPADVAASWRIQATMVYALARVYGHTQDTTDLKNDLYIVLAFDSAKEALKSLGIAAGKAVTRRMIQKHVTREVMVKIWAVLGRSIVTKAGTKSLTSVMRWVPLVGAPIGFGFDWFATRTVGRNAIKYYSGRE